MRIIFAALLILATTTLARAADNPSREAAKHFQRGVDLYNDGDFRGALVEFKRAYTTWPRSNVLYDIGQTEFQLLEYAAALRSMERYLAETGPNAAHRSEVETTVEVLRGRVGIKLPPPPIAALRTVVPPPPAPAHRPDRRGVAIGWTISAILAAATIGVGTATLVEENRLSSLKQSFPVTHDQLDRQATQT